MNDLEYTREKVEKALNNLRSCFIDEAELTFIMRVPGKPEVYMIVSNDKLDELLELLKNR